MSATIVDIVKSREVKLHQIAGKIVRATSDDFGTCRVISFIDGTFLWLDDDNGWRWHGQHLFVGLGVLTPQESAQWDAEQAAEREREEREEELQTLARLKAKYETQGDAAPKGGPV